MGLSRQEYCSGVPFPSPGDLPDPGTEPRSPALKADTLTSESGKIVCMWLVGFPGGSVVKNPQANAGNVDLIPGSGRSPGIGNGNSLQYSCLGNPMDRGLCQATVHGVTKELDTIERLHNKKKQHIDTYFPSPQAEKYLLGKLCLLLS